MAAASSTHPDVVAYRKKLESLSELGSAVQAVNDEADAVLREVRTPVPPPIAPDVIVVLRNEAIVLASEFPEEEATTRRLLSRR